MKMTDEVEAVMGGVRMGVNVDIKRTDVRTTTCSSDWRHEEAPTFDWHRRE